MHSPTYMYVLMTSLHLAANDISPSNRLRMSWWFWFAMQDFAHMLGCINTMFILDRQMKSNVTVHLKTQLTDVESIAGAVLQFWRDFITKRVALAGNRTRAARVAGEHSTTEPPMLHPSFLKAEIQPKVLSFLVLRRAFFSLLTGWLGPWEQTQVSFSVGTLGQGSKRPSCFLLHVHWFAVVVQSHRCRGSFIKLALAGNRTRAARVAGEHSTTEPL